MTGNVPAKPRDVAAELTPSGVKVNWTDGAFNETELEVYRYKPGWYIRSADNYCGEYHYLDRCERKRQPHNTGTPSVLSTQQVLLLTLTPCQSLRLTETLRSPQAI